MNKYLNESFQDLLSLSLKDILIIHKDIPTTLKDILIRYHLKIYNLFITLTHLS